MLSRSYGHLGPGAIAVTLYGLCQIAHANPYLAAFSAGTSTATVAPQAARAFKQFGELVSELTKFAAVLVFGALLTPNLLRRPQCRPVDCRVAVAAAGAPHLHACIPLAGSTDPAERWAAWFGPKGFGSVVYGLLAVQSGTPQAQTVFKLIALTIAVSVVAHSMTDVPIARVFNVEEIAGLRGDDDPGPEPRVEPAPIQPDDPPETGLAPGLR